MSPPDPAAPAGAPPHPAGEWLALVRHQERRGEFLSAYDIAGRGLEEHPDDPELAYRAVLALARTGATLEAERRFAELGLGRLDTEDVAALAARIEKDRALAADGGERRRLAAGAAASYRRIAERTGTYFPAINAATLSLVAGHPEVARDTARQALAAVERSGDRSYYAVATRAEAHLLLGDPGAARVELERAAGLHGGDFAAVSTTRRQLRLVCATAGIDPEVLSALAGPAVAHYCGHMISAPGGSGALRSYDEAAAAAEMARAVEQQPVGFAYGSLAGGADILWAEALLAAGAELHVVLPFAADDFLAASVSPSGSGWVSRFERCLEAAVSVTYATEGAYLGDDALFNYASELAMGLALLRARFLDADAFQLTLWDGAPAAGAVGTGVDVARWGATGHQAVVVTPVEPPGGRPARPPAPERHQAPRVVRAILIGDIRGFSKLTDEQLLAFSRVVMGTFGQVLAGRGPEVEYLNTWGDAVIAVLTDGPAAARCALELQEALGSVDLVAAGLPAQLAFRLSGHVGPVFSAEDPVLGTPTFMGTHISRTARIEPVTPPGAVYVTEEFAAALELAGCADLVCDYVGHMPAAKDYGRLRMYHLRRRLVSAALT